MGETLLSKTLALPIFASDPLSSVAYATEAALVVLVGASVASAHLVLPISIAIAAVLAIVVLSYTQTVQAYETSGGAYVVAKENLGTLPSLVAAAALLVDYVLTVAVSVAAGVLAITSAAPSLARHKVGLSLALILLLTLVNLRGVRESGIAFALPTYAFVAVMYVMIATGIAKCAVGQLPAGARARPDHRRRRRQRRRPRHPPRVRVGRRRPDRRGVDLERRRRLPPPQGENAAQTLLVMGGMAISLFVGVSWLAVQMHARPSNSVSVVSEIARGDLPGRLAGRVPLLRSSRG